MANVQRPVLGQWANLGALYNARTDNFVSQSLLSSAPPSQAVVMTNHHTIELQITFDDSHNTRFKMMSMSPDLGASFLSGLISVDGAAAHLNESRNSNVLGQAAIYHTVKTVEEKLSLATPELRPYLNLDAIYNSAATHVLAAIGWGAQTVLTVNYQHSDNNEMMPVKSLIEAEYRRTERIIKSGGNVFSQQPIGDHTPGVPLDVRVYSDILNEVGRAADLKLGSDFIIDVPNKLRNISHGNGAHLTYTLVPLELLSYMIGVEVKPDAISRPLSIEILENFLAFFDELHDSQQRLNDYYVELKHQAHCAPPQFVDTVARYMHDLKMTEARLKTDYGRPLQDVRGGSDPTLLPSLLDAARRSVASPKHIANMTTQYRDKMAFASSVVASGINYFGYGGGPIEMALLQSNVEDAYVLFFTEKIRHEDNSWQENYRLLYEMHNGGATSCVIAMVDCDATQTKLEKSRISRFRSGRLLIPDVMEQLTHGKCFARYITEDFLEGHDGKKPQRRSPLKIACPGLNCNKDKTFEWVCYKCGVPVEYGHTDQYMYCDCGRSPYDNYEFKCREMHHGNNFERFSRSTLLPLLEALDPFDELNVLIIGETGVGKSTFINAFVNYLTYDTLDESMNDEKLNWVIPCSFNVQNMDRSVSNGQIIQREIKIGQDDDEADGAAGQSATQKTMVYPVILDKTVVRLIDTPGIGDTRGVEKDRENMSNILAMLRNFDKLHGILFLLKSNSPRLTFMFRFVVEELLTHLHRDAANNMVFGFTNTRISNYTPGDTYKPLQTLLERHRNVGISLSVSTVYCFDSESFRFLAAQKAGVVMENIQDFRSSWQHSGSEARRLLEYFRSLPPHNVRSTLSLNHTRDLIMHLTKPMADIMQKIDKTILLNADNLQELTDTKLRGDQLRDKLHFQKIQLVHHALDKPRTVCNDVACKEYRDDGDGKKQTVYKSHCHEQCYLQNVAPEVVSCVELMKCWAFTGENCRICGHHWENHLHVMYELEEQTVTVKDEAIEEGLRKNANDVTLKETAIQHLTEKIAEADYEYKEIQDAAVRFGLFLKKNSITPYNDAMLAYLDHLIKEETEKVQIAGGDRDRLDNLLRHRLEHVQQVEVLTKSMASGGNEELLDEAGVEDLVEHLYKLKHWGKNLRDIKNNAEATHQAAYRERPFRPQTSRHSTSSWTLSRETHSHWNTGKMLANGINWFAGNMTASSAPAPQRRNDAGRRLSAANGMRSGAARNVPVAEANRQQNMQFEESQPRSLSPLVPTSAPGRLRKLESVARSKTSPSASARPPSSKTSATNFGRLLRPFSKRY